MRTKCTFAVGLAVIALTFGAAQAAIQEAEIGGTYDGTQGTVDLTATPYSISLDLQNDFGFTFWVKSDEIPNDDNTALLTWGNADDAQGSFIDEMDNGDRTPAVFGTPSDGRIKDPVDSGDPAGTADVDDGAWHQVAFVYDYDAGTMDGVGSLFIDGAKLADSDGRYAFTASSAFVTAFEGAGKGPLAGEISDIAFFDSVDVLTADKISDFYDAGAGTIPEPATMSLLGLGGLVALRRRRK